MADEKVIIIREKKRPFSGEYVAEVVGDHDQTQRVKVRVEGYFDGIPDDKLPWATYRLALGARPNDGNWTPCDAGDKVWVDFPFDGDTRRPRIVASYHEAPGGTVNLPSESVGNTHCVYKQHGILIEIKDTANGEYYITQLAHNTHIKIMDSGDVDVYTPQNIFAKADKNIEATAGVDIKADAGENINATAGTDITADAGQNITATAGQNVSVTAAMNVNITATSQAVTVVGGSAINLTAPLIGILGAITMASPGGGSAPTTETKKALTDHEGSYTLDGPMTTTGSVTFNGNLQVNGNINATGNIIAAGSSDNHHSHP